MSWFSTRSDITPAEVTVTGPNEVVAELPYSKASQDILSRTKVGHHAVVADDKAAVDGTVTGVDGVDFTVTIMTRKLW